MKKSIPSRFDNLIGELDGLKFKDPHSPYPPDHVKIEKIISYTRRILLFDVLEHFSSDAEGEGALLTGLYLLIKEVLNGFFSPSMAEETSLAILNRLSGIKAALLLDASAIIRGDPAATSIEEVAVCYPGFFALMVYRVARLFYEKEVPYIPRMLTEYAHGTTGIDIHPGAKIGSCFCIDHGTGIVVGQTAEIGDRVRMYQGVTVGAKSIVSDSDGLSARGNKRHPTSEDDCIIYAGATILGGDTVVGRGSVIGGNVRLTHSVAAGSRIYYDKK